MTAVPTEQSPTGLDPRGHRTALETHELTVTYGSFTAVDRVSVSVGRGEIHGLLGPNGAGKTSVIRALTTIVPSTGSASVNGFPLTDRVGVRSVIGVLPESNGYPGAQTGRSYLRFYGQLFGLDRNEADRRAERLLLRFGLAHNQGRIATFSRGMRQRLGLARALINDPAVLFLDEPTLGLDPAGKADILAHLIRTAMVDGTCVVLCSHLLDEVERVCDRVSIMHRGRIVTEGTVDDVIAAAGAAGYGTVRVPPHQLGAADQVLREASTAISTRYDNTKPGELSIQLGSDPGARSELVRSLLDAGIEVRAFDLQGARLSDAFLALTDAARPLESDESP